MCFHGSRVWPFWFFVVVLVYGAGLLQAPEPAKAQESNTPLVPVPSVTPRTNMLVPENVQAPVKKPETNPKNQTPKSSEKQSASAKPTVDQICKLIASSADRYNLPKPYFARLIWKESRFDHLAVSPVGAQGIAQFMPGTARIVGLKNPWNVAEAIPASASHLNDLRNAFGNLGLAAAAYNAGAGRISAWLTRGSFLPLETEDYVYSITGEPAAVFSKPARRIKLRPLDKKLSFDQACRNLKIVLTRSRGGGRSMSQIKPKPWGIQIAGNFRRSVVERSVRRLRKVIGKRKVYIQRRKTPNARRSIYAARIGANSRKEANRICSRLRSAGGACVVTKN